MYETLALLAGFAAVYSVIAGRIERTWISGPIIFLAFGVLIGPVGLGLLSEQTSPELLRTLAELTLALVLFTDAAGADLGVLRRAKALPFRLLAIGLPLTIALGFGVGKLLFGTWPILEIALLATMLAPTDAALGKAVVTNEAVPDTVRQGLNVESGLNDGICVPILLLFLALITEKDTDRQPWALGLEFFAEDVGIGLAAGVLLTAAAAWLIRLVEPRAWLSPTWIKVTVIALAFTCFGTAQACGGSGFIASFAAGLLFGAVLKGRHEKVLNAAEGIGDTFSLLTWVLFGSAVVGQAIGSFTWPMVLYAVLSLTLVRMLPVFVSVAGLGISTEGRLFLGWFGPRGLASIVFAVIVLGAEVPHANALNMVVACTVLLSVVAHGVTANPWARGYGSRAPTPPPGMGAAD